MKKRKKKLYGRKKKETLESQKGGIVIDGFKNRKKLSCSKKAINAKNQEVRLKSHKQKKTVGGSKKLKRLEIKMRK